ncbi:MAG: ssDNA-binding domain-containing protein [Clostridiales bacterium]|nr:ssDNA-binding domain-containing protein [Clostridiales bacterium]
MSKSKIREQMIAEFLKALRKEQIPWNRPWVTQRPQNAVSGKEYRGINALFLSYIQGEAGYKDCRWCTFHQAKEAGWNIKKGARGTPVEFWSLYDKKRKKTISMLEAEKLKEQIPPEEYKERIYPVVQNYTVFNGEQITGIPEFIMPGQLLPEELLTYRETLVDNMGVTFMEDSVDKSYYVPLRDEIHLPPPEFFKTPEFYFSVFLHEAGHATGHESRLNRPFGLVKGSSDYAKEELRAEIASAFTEQFLGLGVSDRVYMENHKAYIKNWIEVLENNPEELFAAIKDAEKISDYLIEQGRFKAPQISLDNQKTMRELTFAEQIDAVLAGKANPFNSLKVCDTPQILLDVGLSQLPMLYTQRHLKDALHPKSNQNPHWHGLTVEQVKKIPELLRKPAMVFDSMSKHNPASIGVVLNAVDHDNAPILVIVKPGGKGTYELEQIGSNFITSIYGKDHSFDQYVSGIIENNKMLFADKEKSQELFSCLQLQLPQAINNLDFNIIIHKSQNIVNSQNLDNQQKAKRKSKSLMEKLSDNQRILDTRNVEPQGNVQQKQTEDCQHNDPR